MAIIFIIILIISSAVFAYTGMMQATTLYVGKKIADPMLADVMPNGYQDAITPEHQNKMNDLNNILLVAVLIVGSLVRWYWGILGLILDIVLLRTIFQYFFVPQKLSFYVNLLVMNMANRYADYKKDKDEERALASKEIGDKLNEYFVTMDKNMKVPTFDEASKTPFGI
ncbi:hypothetical protein KBC75_01860 [Candidatus Shapirobacteria bacterium]|nr:hypothetical protein [Candidatus Shapirobacteria bacterium]